MANGRNEEEEKTQSEARREAWLVRLKLQAEVKLRLWLPLTSAEIMQLKASEDGEVLVVSDTNVCWVCRTIYIFERRVEKEIEGDDECGVFCNIPEASTFLCFFLFGSCHK